MIFKLLQRNICRSQKKFFLKKLGNDNVLSFVKAHVHVPVMTKQAREILTASRKLNKTVSLKARKPSSLEIKPN